MIRKPIFSFNSTSSTGLDLVPLNSVIVIEDSDGSGTPKKIFLFDKTSITGATTINTLLTTMDTQWSEFGGSGSGSGSGWTYVEKSAAYDAEPGDYIYADTSSSAFIITLPLSPDEFDTVVVLDSENSFGDNNLTIDRNASNLIGETSNLDLSSSALEHTFVYLGTSWEMYTSYKHKYSVSTPSPELTGITTTNEQTQVILFITNYDTVGYYTADVDGGSVVQSNNQITWTFGAVATDTDYTLDLSFTDTSGTSEVTSHTVTVLNIDSYADDAVSITDHIGNGQIIIGWDIG